MLKNKYMDELSVEELIDNLNFYVPEIQREYVWGHNEREILDVFFADLIEGKKSQRNVKDITKEIAALSEKGKFEEIKKLVNAMEDVKPINIGFLYSYAPDYRMEHFPQSDVNKDVYLIDGQQRLTTLFILLFYLSIKESRKQEFCEMFRFNKDLETVAFDYRVRNLTHNFFVDLISNVEALNGFSNIEKSTWFLREYSNDPTVAAVLKALKIISTHFGDTEDKYFDYLKTQVKFWHFKTEKTDQGEELYITMNSRGKHLEDNETIRAKLFEGVDKKEELSWSEEWERWQDFFWSHRNKDDVSGNADQGFNEFLKCIAGLEALISDLDDFLGVNEIIYTSRLLKHLSLSKIKKYYDAFSFVYNNKETFKSEYTYSQWVDDCFLNIKKILFDIDASTNWFIDYNDDLRARERMNMVFMWSILHYINSIEICEDSLDEVYRFVRVFWVRYNNHDRSVKTVLSRCTETIKDGVWSNSITDDEKAKHGFLSSIDVDDDLRRLESSLWRLEDHPLNLNGYQVNNQNITHLVDFSDNITPEIIDSIHFKFCKLFDPNKPVGSIGSKKLNTTLLYYGFYAMRRSPYYYENWDFSSWRRIVRDLDSAKNVNVFKNFFSDYNGLNIDDVLNKKQDEFLTNNADKIKNAVSIIDCESLIDCLRYYAFVIEDLWVKGRYVAVSDYLPHEKLTTYEVLALFNTKGNFRGYNHVEFCDMVDKSKKPALDYLKMLAKKATATRNGDTQKGHSR